MISDEKYNLLSQEYDDLYFQMLLNFQKELKIADKKYSKKTYSFLYPSLGEMFLQSRKVLIYGQCINGKWKPSFNLNNDINKDVFIEGKTFSNSCDSGETSPLDWVNNNWSEYSLYRSFFWNVAYKVTNKLIGVEDYKCSEEWSKHMAWSNLMKIGNIKGGNPKKEEYYAQINLSIKLFIKELEELKPEVTILLSGQDFSEEFTNQLGLKPNIEGKEFVIFAYKVKNTKLILTNRPRFGNNEKCVEEIIEAIANL